MRISLAYWVDVLFGPSVAFLRIISIVFRFCVASPSRCRNGTRRLWRKRKENGETAPDETCHYFSSGKHALGVRRIPSP